MSPTASRFEELISYSLRVELLNGKVLIYRLDTENRNFLINKLGKNSEGDEENKNIPFLWFETSFKRHVIINTGEILRVTFLLDYEQPGNEADGYFDNFEVVEKDTSLLPKATADGDTRLYVTKEEYLPQVMIYHKGKLSVDNYYTNPLQYLSLEEGCLELFYAELDGLIPLRQFINLRDNDGEESFIPLQQVIVMEFDNNLLYDSEGEEEFESGLQSDEGSDEELDKIFGSKLSSTDQPSDPVDFNLLVDEHLKSIMDINRLLDEDAGKAKDEDYFEE